MARPGSPVRFLARTGQDPSTDSFVSFRFVRRRSSGPTDEPRSAHARTSSERARRRRTKRRDAHAGEHGNETRAGRGRTTDVARRALSSLVERRTALCKELSCDRLTGAIPSGGRLPARAGIRGKARGGMSGREIGEERSALVDSLGTGPRGSGPPRVIIASPAALRARACGFGDAEAGWPGDRTCKGFATSRTASTRERRRRENWTRNPRALVAGHRDPARRDRGRVWRQRFGKLRAVFGDRRAKARNRALRARRLRRRAASRR